MFKHLEEKISRVQISLFYLPNHEAKNVSDFVAERVLFFGGYPFLGKVL